MKYKKTNQLDSYEDMLPKGEPEFNMNALLAAWDQIMAPSTAAAATSVALSKRADLPPEDSSNERRMGKESGGVSLK